MEAALLGPSKQDPDAACLPFSVILGHLCLHDLHFLCEDAISNFHQLSADREAHGLAWRMHPLFLGNLS